MTAGDWVEVAGLWMGLFTTGYVAGQLMRWFQGIGEKL